MVRPRIPQIPAMSASPPKFILPADITSKVVARVDAAAQFRGARGTSSEVSRRSLGVVPWLGRTCRGEERPIPARQVLRRADRGTTGDEIELLRGGVRIDIKRGLLLLFGLKGPHWAYDVPTNFCQTAPRRPPQSCFAPTVSAITAPRSPSGLSWPIVESSAV
jgi:hypothetical protein